MEEELDELPPFYDSIEEYEVNDDKPCDLHGLPNCPTCLFGGYDNLSEPIGGKE